MAESTQYMFQYPELVEALIKQQGLHEGLWMLRVEFGLGATNIQPDEGSKELTPAAVIPVKGIGLQKGREENNLTLDAAKVNPKPKAVRGKGKK